MNPLDLWRWLENPENWTGVDGIPHRLTEHLYYSGLALAIAVAIAVPLGILIGHTNRGGFLAVNSANAARALPTIGLVILVVVVTHIGLAPILVALVALAVPPIDLRLQAVAAGEQLGVARREVGNQRVGAGPEGVRVDTGAGQCLVGDEVIQRPRNPQIAYCDPIRHGSSLKWPLILSVHAVAHRSHHVLHEILQSQQSTDSAVGVGQQCQVAVVLAQPG